MKSKKKELASYSGTTKKIAELKKKIESTQTKLDVIKKLEKNKTGPVLLLDEISQTVPKEKLWLQSLQEKSGILSLKGSAMDNETLSLFMKNLEKAEHIRSVDLKSAKSKTLSNYKLSIIDFMLSCKIYSYKEKEKKKNKSRRRR
ncbi:MAG: PilN domain-containing protein [Deltaproteobacteria bacterium]|nr:PilN domain-containing protein [Deltaproteobacteria bacterium]